MVHHWRWRLSLLNRRMYSTAVPVDSHRSYARTARPTSRRSAGRGWCSTSRACSRCIRSGTKKVMHAHSWCDMWQGLSPSVERKMMLPVDPICQSLARVRSWCTLESAGRVGTSGNCSDLSVFVGRLSLARATDPESFRHVRSFAHLIVHIILTACIQARKRRRWR